MAARNVGQKTCNKFWNEYGLRRIVHIFARLLLPLVLIFGNSAVAQEFLVNTTTASSQGNPAIASLVDGGFVITWTDASQSGADTNNFAIRAQLYDAAGIRKGTEFLVNTTTINAQQQSNVAGLSDGGFVVVWQDNSASSGDAFGFDIHAQRFDSTGSKIDGELLVNSTTAGNQEAPVVAGLVGGGFVVSWTDLSQSGDDTSNFAVRARQYTSAGLATTDDFVVNTIILGGQFQPAIAALSNGGFIVTWTDTSGKGDDPSQWAILGQRFGADGQAQGPELPVNTTHQGLQRRSSVAALPGGGFVVGWMDGSQSGADASSEAIRAQRFDETGSLQGTEFLVNSSTNGAQTDPDISSFADNGFLITWMDEGLNEGDTSDQAVRAQRYDALGNRQGVEFLVNTTVLAGQLAPEAASLPGDAFVLTWADASQSDDDPSLFAIRADIIKPTTLFSSVLPSARSGYVGAPSPITVFASVINAGAESARNCSIAIASDAPVQLGFQQTDATNSPVGSANQPFELAPGQAMSFLLSFVPTTTSPGIDIFPNFVCSNASVSRIPGVNTVFLSIDSSEVPDILSIGATPSADGIITVPLAGTSFMTASATNIGIGDASGSADTAVVVSLDTGDATLPLLLQLCETDAASQCLPASPLGTGPVNTTISNSASFFAVFISDQSTQGVPFDPAGTRVFLRFKNAAGNTLSVTSAAVRVP
jgi:hypothetical protein